MHYTTAPLYIFDRNVTEANECLAAWCGCIPYDQALRLQLKICGFKKHGYEKDVLLLLEHPPVITLGRSADKKNLLVDKGHLECRGIDLMETDRGGDITFHGPGQLVGYPILSLLPGERDVRGYMNRLEESLIRLLRIYGIRSTRDAHYRGVWTENGKIAAMGVHLSRWITRHGFALNVYTDLSFFDMIVPCGISGRAVTTMQEHLVQRPELRAVADKYIQEFGCVFERPMVRMDAVGLFDELNRFEEETAAAPESGSHCSGKI